MSLAFESVKALLFAEKCGVAFQLTNILRDVREDAAVESRLPASRRSREVLSAVRSTAVGKGGRRVP